MKESFTSLFLKQLKLKALAIAKYVDAEPLVYIYLLYKEKFFGVTGKGWSLPKDKISL